MLPLLEQLAADLSTSSEIRLWAIGAVLRLADGKTVSSSAMSALLGRYKARSPVMNPRSKAVPVHLETLVPETHFPANPEDARQAALAHIRTLKGQ
jgi:hypothetical protein